MDMGYGTLFRHVPEMGGARSPRSVGRDVSVPGRLGMPGCFTLVDHLPPTHTVPPIPDGE
jgi:hypothetical protein